MVKHLFLISALVAGWNTVIKTAIRSALEIIATNGSILVPAGKSKDVNPGDGFSKIN